MKSCYNCKGTNRDTDTYCRNCIEAWTLDALIEVLGEFNCSYDEVLNC